MQGVVEGSQSPGSVSRVRAWAASLRERSNQRERLDDPRTVHDEQVKSLKEVGFCSRYLGGHSLGISALQIALAMGRFQRPPHLVDLGCGGGESLRAAAKWARAHGAEVRLTGVDVSPAAVELSRQHCQEWPEIEVVQGDALSCDWSALRPDIVTANLFCHHLGDEDLSHFFGLIRDSSARVLVINDLQRHWLAYASFSVVSRLAGLSSMSREDGLVSILRGFRREEFDRWAQTLDSFDWCVEQRFPFLYRLSACR